MMHNDPAHDDIKTQFFTREGPYKAILNGDYTRPPRIYAGPPLQPSIPIQLSFITSAENDIETKICFNIGRELYFYEFAEIGKPPDLTRPIDKRTYKGTCPTCHDIALLPAMSSRLFLLIGFSMGQIQLIDPIQKEFSRLYNEDRLVDKSKATCIKWIPSSPTQFLVTHSSGQLYVYNQYVECPPVPPTYQLFKSGDGFSIYTCKTKTNRNPLYRWIIGEGAINQAAFSPCSKYLAVVSQDGFLRTFDYDQMELVGAMRSYFGGILCVAWSPDGDYIVTGGEDDLVTVFSFREKRVICRGFGHQSWVNKVAFDPFVSLDCDPVIESSFYGSEEDLSMLHPSVSPRSTRPSTSFSNHLFYRFGSVGQDTQLCLWDLTEDVLVQSARSRASTAHLSASRHLSLSGVTGSGSMNSGLPGQNAAFVGGTSINSVAPVDGLIHNQVTESSHHTSTSTTGVGTLKKKLGALSFGNKDRQKAHKHEKSHSLSKQLSIKPSPESTMMLGSFVCPRLGEIPRIEPVVIKKIAHERLTDIVFQHDCFVVACQDGYVQTWARPGHELLKNDTEKGNASAAGDGGTVV